jgi:hypothetical protein
MGDLIVYFLFPFDFLVKWLYHLELAVMFRTIYLTRSGFLFSGLSIFSVSTSNSVRCQIATGFGIYYVAVTSMIVNSQHDG